MQRSSMKEKIKVLGSLKVKFSIITFFTYMLLVGSTLFACYRYFYHNMILRYESMGEDILNHASDEINIDHIPGYFSGAYEEEYAALQKKLDKYVLYYKEIYYLYGYKINRGSEMATVLFDAQTKHDSKDNLGDDYELEYDIVAQMDKLENGKPIDPLIDNTKWGFLLTCSKPLIGSDGKCQGYLFVDFNLTKVKEDDIQFILKLFIIIFFITLVILFFATKTVTERITGPIEKIYLCLKSFKFATNEDREENLERLKGLGIRTNPEIQGLYDTLISTTLESYTYQQEYRVATEKLGVASEMAFKDALTGAGNKNAYENEMKMLQNKMDKKESIELSIFMVDINNLKYVNDTFGHSKGDAYIKGCCNIIKKLCKYSKIYRIGGDEFVVLVRENDYMNRQEIYHGIVENFESAFTNESNHPWERYSAAVGMADFSFEDQALSDTVKRADSAMYKAKSEFKERYGSYR